MIQPCPKCGNDPCTCALEEPVGGDEETGGTEEGGTPGEQV